jgi:putative endonuclease
MKQPVVYMMANQKHGVLYVGVTSNLIQRVYQHKESVVDGFTKRYGCKNLVYYEVHHEMEYAIHREKRLKKYKREQKIRLIENMNPDWLDLYADISL